MRSPPYILPPMSRNLVKAHATIAALADQANELKIAFTSANFDACFTLCQETIHKPREDTVLQAYAHIVLGGLASKFHAIFAPPNVVYLYDYVTPYKYYQPSEHLKRAQSLLNHVLEPSFPITQPFTFPSDKRDLPPPPDPHTSTSHHHVHSMLSIAMAMEKQLGNRRSLWIKDSDDRGFMLTPEYRESLEKAWLVEWDDALMRAGNVLEWYVRRVVIDLDV